MKHVLKVEQDPSMRIYQKFNREEKELMKDMRENYMEKTHAAQMVVKNVVQTHIENRRKRSEEREFANNFA